MEHSSWWRGELNTDGLSQGDLVKPLPFATTVVPPERIKRKTARGGAQTLASCGWSPVASTGKELFLFQGKGGFALVISHSCDLDKRERRSPVLCAPVRAADALPDHVRQRVFAQERISLMPLPAIPGHGDHYADLRSISPMPRELLAEESRIASMSPHGLSRLLAQLVKFFTRIEASYAEKLVAGG